MKEACRLLFECMDECRKHDQEYQYITSEVLKSKFLAFLEKHKLNTPENITNILGINCQSGFDNVISS